MTLQLLPPAPLPAVNAVLLVAVAAVAAVTDIRARRIPNWLTVAGFAAGLAVNTWARGWAGLGDALLGCALGFVLYLVLYLLRGMCAGDVKLAGALCAITGLERAVALILFAWIASAVLGLMAALVRGRLRTTLWNTGYLVRELASLRAPYLTHEQLDVRQQQTLRLPHGVSLAAGSVALLLAARFWLRP
jgi:prepilin peptidase CpaA